MKLFEHQVQSLEQTKDSNRVAYFLDMGLGKTFVGAEKMIRLGAEVNLLICQKSKIQDWRNHFADYYKYDISAYDLTNKKQWSDFWENPCGFRYRVGIINYELAWRRKDLLKLKDFTLMLDESSLIQNDTAKQTKFILKLQAKNVILLSGTPTAGKYENLWTQAKLLGWDIKKTLYNSQYINWKRIDVFDPQTFGTRNVKVVDKKDPYKNIERLKQKFRDHGAVFMKTEEVISLPEQIFTEIRCPVSKEYNKFLKTQIVTVEGVELVGDTTLTERLYLRQLCGQYSEAKLQAFRDLVSSTNDRVIVFYNFTAEVEKLIHIANEFERPFSIINGAGKNLFAYEEYSDSITFVQYQAGSMGHNLQKANKIIYFTLPERSELFEQSKKRIHRIGQNQPCFYYVMMCDKSIEEDIYRTLKLRKDYTDELFRERRKNGTRKAARK